MDPTLFRFFFLAKEDEEEGELIHDGDEPTGNNALVNCERGGTSNGKLLAGLLRKQTILIAPKANSAGNLVLWN